MSPLQAYGLPEEARDGLIMNKVTANRVEIRANQQISGGTIQVDDSPLYEKSSYHTEGDDDETFSLSPPSASSDESSVSTTISEMQVELKFSLPSDLFFLIGSIISVYTSLSDWKWLNAYYYYYYGDDDTYYQYYQSSNDTYYQSSNENDTPSSSSTTLSTYMVLSIIGSIALVLNPAFDLSCCIYKLRQNPEITSLCHKEILCDSSSSIAFGIAALIDLRSSFLYKKVSGSKLGLMGIISSHFYLLSAIISLSKSSFQYSTVVKRLWFVGDTLFLVASLADVIISYISDPAIISEPVKILYGCWLFSSVLWLIDACK